jgi:hypothetical protein
MIAAVMSVRLLLVGVLAVGLPACSNGSDTGQPEADRTPATSSAASSSSSSSPSSVDSSAAGTGSPSSTAPQQPVIDVVHQPGEGEFEGALDDIEFTCTTDGATWTAEGTVTNSTAAPAGYRIFMGFLDSAGETVALVEAEVTGLPAAESDEWSVQFASSAGDLRCVPRVERRAG